MSPLDPSAGLPRPLAAAIYVAAVTAFLLLQEVGLRLRREEHRAWWAGSGRDLLNVGGLLAISGALRLLRLPGPTALLVGGTVTLLLFGASVLVATQLEVRHPRAVAVAFGLAVAAPALLFTPDVAQLAARVVGTLFAAAPGAPPS